MENHDGHRHRLLIYGRFDGAKSARGLTAVLLASIGICTRFVFIPGEGFLQRINSWFGKVELGEDLAARVNEMIAFECFAGTVAAALCNHSMHVLGVEVVDIMLRFAT